jgi:hypothetical protein
MLHTANHQGQEIELVTSASQGFDVRQSIQYTSVHQDLNWPNQDLQESTHVKMSYNIKHIYQLRSITLRRCMTVCSTDNGDNKQNSLGLPQSAHT